MSRDLSRLLRPRSLAVVGGGPWAANAIEASRAMGFEGPLRAVNPRRSEIAGVPCHSSVDALPEVPDAAFVAVNAEATVDVVAALAARGAGGAVCFASGFAEAAGGPGGAARQARLLSAAGGMPLLGPNCYGLLNYLDRAALWPDVHGGAPVERGVAVIAQSSNMLITITMSRRGLPLSHVVAAGNQAQVTVADLASALMDDPRVSAVGMHVEGMPDPSGFEALAAKARSRRVPLAVLRVGRSEAAKRATLTHTASLAGGDAASRAFFERIGIPALDSLPAFLETLSLLHTHGALDGEEIACMSCSGGEAALAADAAASRGVRFAPLPEATRARLSRVLGDRVVVANPLDYHTDIWGDPAAMAEVFAAVIDAGAPLALLVVDYPRADRCNGAAWDCVAQAAIAAGRQTEGRLAVVSTLPETLDEPVAQPFAAEGIAVLHGLDEAMAAISAASALGRAWRAPDPLPVLRSDAPLGPRTVLDERVAKISLAAHGIPVPLGKVAADADEAVQAAEALDGPVALKALGIAHKTEHSALRLGLSGEAAVREAAGGMAAPEGFLVERMVEGALAELLVGIVRDPVQGFTLTLGAGGTLTELLADRRTLLVPSPAEAVRDALGTLRLWPLLAGYRGRPAADIDAVVSTILALQAFASVEADRLLEVEVNPLLVTAQGGVAADALIVLGPRQEPDGG